MENNSLDPKLHALELEKFKIHKIQMYLQITSVLMSGILLYVLISGKKEDRDICSEFMSKD